MQEDVNEDQGEIDDWIQERANEMKTIADPKTIEKVLQAIQNAENMQGCLIECNFSDDELKFFQSIRP
jgi:hypothetical protein